MELEIVPMPEQILKTEKASSYGGNFSELSSGVLEVEGKSSEIIPNIGIEEAEHHVEVQEVEETVVIQNEEDVGME